MEEKQWQQFAHRAVRELRQRDRSHYAAKHMRDLIFLDFLVVDVPKEKPALLSGRNAQNLGYLKIYADKLLMLTVRERVKLHNFRQSGSLQENLFFCHRKTI